MILTKAQKIIAKDKHRFRVINCGRRFGKTTLSIEEIKGRALYIPSRIAYIAPTYPQARDIAWQMLKNELKPIIKNINESRLELVVHTQSGKEESIIQLRGWENIESLRGQRLDFIVIDEVAMMRNFWLNWEEIIRPTLTDSAGEVMFISTPKGFNHFYDLYNKEAEDKDYKSFHFTSYDNPYLPKEELDKAKKELPEDRFAQEYMADFRKTEGLVYKEFSRLNHTYTKFLVKEIKDVITGLDFGYTNPSAIIKIVVDKNDNFWIEDEWYKNKQTNEQIAEIVNRFEPNIVYPDPASPDRIAELATKGINIRDVNKGKDSVINGINKVRELLKTNRLKINKKCVNTIWEFESYCYPDDRRKRTENEIPLKENDHAMDAIRYALMSYVPTRTKPLPIKQFKPDFKKISYLRY